MNSVKIRQPLILYRWFFAPLKPTYGANELSAFVPQADLHNTLRRSMDYRCDEYLKMMEAFLACGNALQGKKMPPDRSWQIYVEPMAKKCIYHLGSLFVVHDGTKLPDMLGQPIMFIDFPSMAILTRAAFEATSPFIIFL